MVPLTLGNWSPLVMNHSQLFCPHGKCGLILGDGPPAVSDVWAGGVLSATSLLAVVTHHRFQFFPFLNRATRLWLGRNFLWDAAEVVGLFIQASGSPFFLLRIPYIEFLQPMVLKNQDFGIRGWDTYRSLFRISRQDCPWRSSPLRLSAAGPWDLWTPGNRPSQYHEPHQGPLRP
jgi:hypothetical protein